MNPNETPPRFDISTFLPLGVGAISLFGICLLLIASRLATPRATVQVPDTATPFRYLFLGTEPGISSAMPSPGEEGFELTPGNSITSTREVGFSITAQSGFAGLNSRTPTSRATQQPTLTPSPGSRTRTVTPTLPTRFATVTRVGITNTPATLLTVPGPTNTVAAIPTQTPGSAAPPPLNSGTYDDTDPRLIYSGSWVNQTGVPGAESGTLHVSQTIGNTITFRFIGDQLRIFYQSGSGLGFMTAVIDGQQYPPLNLNGLPSVNSEWAITSLTNATHTVTITHSSGGSINLDQIIVPDVASATGTATATATATFTP
jgi:hypothetical protein